MQYNYTHINKRGYKSISSGYSNKVIGETKHYPVAIKEWSNSVYSFNKSSTKDLYSKDLLTNTIIKNYFNMDKTVSSTKSRRMRNLLKRSSTKQIFVSKSTIKQTNDRTIINIFTFDRSKKKFNKKLFFYKNILNHLIKSNITKKRIKRKLYRKVVSKYRPNFNSLTKLLNLALINKKQNLKTLFFFYFLKWSLSAFRLKITFLREGDKFIKNNVVHNLKTNTFFIYSNKYNGTRILKKNSDKYLYLDSKEFYKTFNVKGEFTLKRIMVMNDILYKYLYILLLKSFGEKKSKVMYKIYFLFKIFKDEHYKIFVRKLLKKEFVTMYYLYKLYVNKVKTNESILGLRYILSQIYNKKIELNIVNLKYLYLNSDIYTNAIIVKIKKKTSKLLRILKKSLKLVKIPKKIRSDLTIHKNIELLTVDRSYTGISMFELTNNLVITKNKFKDRLNSVLCNMFGVSNAKLHFHKNILSSLKYKWITGVRLETKGRLTKRFTASRSLFKFKYKGNLKNMDYLNKSINNSTMNINKTSKLHIIRNELKPNIQYTATNSKRRIGAFGIKGWVSNN